MLEATDWRWQPVAGGLLDQPEELLQDIAVISQRVSYIEAREEWGAHTAATTDGMRTAEGKPLVMHKGK